MVSRNEQRCDAEDASARPLDHVLARGDPDATALLLRDGCYTFSELETLVGRWAAWLGDRYEAGDRIATWLAKGLVACVLPLACARAGLVYVPINPLLKRAQVSHICADCEPVLLVASPSRLDTLAEDDLPAATQTMTDDAFAVAGEDCEPSQRSDWHPDRLAALLYTSGSTGKPKGVMLSHANLWLGAVSVASYLELQEDDVTLAVLPLSFDYGQNQLYSTWFAGGAVVPLDYLFPKDVVKACGNFGVTTLAGVPPLWMQLMEPDWPPEIAAKIRRVTNSGGALTPQLLAQLRDTFTNADIFPMYGLTEAFRSTYLPPSMVRDFPTSIGWAVPYAEIILVAEDGTPIDGPGEGELVHCGPLVAAGYWRDAERTRARFKPAPGGSRYGGTAVWSGDRVRRDAHDLFYFVGRGDAMIKTYGNRVSPEEVEGAARDAGAPEAVVAMGVADERAGQLIHLIVEGEAGFDTKALRDRMARRLPNFMIPAHIHVIDTMPRTPNGKFDRTLLASRYGEPE